jgi:hypothetical protein
VADTLGWTGGLHRELFPREAVTLLHESCLGAHRDLDRLASLCLQKAARRKRKLVDSDTVREVLECQHSPASPVPAPPAAWPSASVLTSPSTSLRVNT